MAVENSDRKDKSKDNLWIPYKDGRKKIKVQFTQNHVFEK